MNHDQYSDAYLRDILRQVRRIAVIGASTKWTRPSYFVMKYLMLRGYTILPVNPRAQGQQLLGVPVYGSLEDVPGPIDMVDIFRRSDVAAEVARDAIRLKDDKQIKVVWMQLTVRHDEAAAEAEAAGLRVVMNRCPKIEYSRLNGELSWNGINSDIITSKRRKAVYR
ncbi:MAG: CoA-binding protein [Myxococcota bacterium]